MWVDLSVCWVGRTLGGTGPKVTTVRCRAAVPPWGLGAGEREANFFFRGRTGSWACTDSRGPSGHSSAPGLHPRAVSNGRCSGDMEGRLPWNLFLLQGGAVDGKKSKKNHPKRNKTRPVPLMQLRPSPVSKTHLPGRRQQPTPGISVDSQPPCTGSSVSVTSLCHDGTWLPSLSVPSCLTRASRLPWLLLFIHALGVLFGSLPGFLASGTDISIAARPPPRLQVVMTFYPDQR